MEGFKKTEEGIEKQAGRPQSFGLLACSDEHKDAEHRKEPRVDSELLLLFFFFF